MTHPVLILPNLQCAQCGSALFLDQGDWRKAATEWLATCHKCEVTALVPLQRIDCQIVESNQLPRHK